MNKEFAHNDVNIYNELNFENCKRVVDDSL